MGVSEVQIVYSAAQQMERSTTYPGIGIATTATTASAACPLTDAHPTNHLPSSRGPGTQPNFRSATAPTATAANSTIVAITSSNSQQPANVARAVSKVSLADHSYSHDHAHCHPSLASSSIALALVPHNSTPADAASAKRSQDDDNVWATNTVKTEEHERIREFSLDLGENESRNLFEAERDTFLEKQRMQQKHSCSHAGCGRERHVIEEELNILHGTYHEELEEHAIYQRHYIGPGSTIPPASKFWPFPGNVELNENDVAIRHSHIGSVHPLSQSSMKPALADGVQPPENAFELDDNESEAYDYGGWNDYDGDGGGYDGGGYDGDGYDGGGSEGDGYDGDGYDEDGYNREGYDEHGYDEDEDDEDEYHGEEQEGSEDEDEEEEDEDDEDEDGEDENEDDEDGDEDEDDDGDEENWDDGEDDDNDDEEEEVQRGRPIVPIIIHNTICQHIPQEKCKGVAQQYQQRPLCEPEDEDQRKQQKIVTEEEWVVTAAEKVAEEIVRKAKQYARKEPLRREGGDGTGRGAAKVVEEAVMKAKQYARKDLLRKEGGDETGRKATEEEKRREEEGDLKYFAEEGMDHEEGQVKEEPSGSDSGNPAPKDAQMDATYDLDGVRSRFPRDLTMHISRDDKFPVAAGGHADIYKGTLRTPQTSIKVAIKVIKTYSGAGDNHEKKKRWRREIKVWMNLDHANVLPFFGTASGFGPFPVMVCPWLENGTLTSYLDRRNDNLEILQVLSLIHDVASGLRYLHSQSIVHGDLSGSNVLIEANGKARIADFGLSTVLDEIGGSTFTASSTGKQGGTLRWAAPELHDLADHEDEKPQHIQPTIESDIYSFGGIMLQILSGKVPYHYYARDVLVILAIVKGETPARPDDPRITDSRWGFIQRCWSPFKILIERPSSEEIVAFSRDDLVASWVQVVERDLHAR